MNRLKNATEALEKIVEKEGHCLHRHICEQCPFRKRCLPTFLNKNTRITPAERLSLAIDVLANLELLEEENDADISRFFEVRIT